MTDNATDRLDAIHSMLVAGHRSLRIERHSLILWGLTGGMLFLFGHRMFTAAQIPQIEQRALAWVVFLTVVLGSVGAIDWYLTGRTKQKRDQAWSFVHRQVLKVWWLLFALGTLLFCGMFFFGGGHMLNAAWIIIAGLGLYIHGLFSEELLEWTGALTIAIGVCTLAFMLNPQTSKLVGAAVFGIGFPLLALMLNRSKAWSVMRRLSRLMVWLLCVLGPPLLFERYANAVAEPEAPTVSLGTFLHQPPVSGPQVVAMPAGTTIPVNVEVSGGMFRGGREAVWSMALAHPLEVMMVDGQLTGEYRFAGDTWVRAKDTILISVPAIKAELISKEGPRVHTNVVIKVLGKGAP